VEPSDVAEVVETYGQLVVGEHGELMVEFEGKNAADALSKALSKQFGDQVLLSP
jgi:phosphoenolpyruvate carboxylase